MKNYDLDSDVGHANLMNDLQQSLGAPALGTSQTQASQPTPASTPSMVATVIGDVNTTSEIGACNLCELIKTLTEDHVPPKSCQLEEYNKKHWIHYAFTPSSTPLYSQGKVKFKTLCEDCNTTLGRQVDKELRNLIFFIRKCRNKGINRDWAYLNTRKIAVSVVAHLQAQMVAFDPNHKSKFSSAAQAIFKDMGISGFKNLKIYYSIDQNPDGYSVINEGILSYAESGKRKQAPFSCLKMPEICFYVTTANSFMGLPRLSINEQQLFEFKRLANKQAGKAISYPNFPEGPSTVDVALFLGINGMKSTAARKSNQAVPGPSEVTDAGMIAVGEQHGIKFMVWPE